MHRLRPHLNYANVAASLALIIAVAGVPTAVAISASKKTSDVNKNGNIRAGRVTAAKLANGSVTAAKLAAIDVVQASDSGGFAVATCPGGERLLGGGAKMNSFPPGVALTRSAPSDNTWQAQTNSAANVTTYALCLR
jgi:hypothetical protein